jgi:hypothetical protein
LVGLNEVLSKKPRSGLMDLKRQWRLGKLRYHGWNEPQLFQRRRERRTSFFWRSFSCMGRKQAGHGFSLEAPVEPRRR